MHPSLGTAEAEGRRYYIEWPAIAGLDRLVDEERLPNAAKMPMTLAIVIIKSNFIVGDQERRAQLDRLAIDRLNLDPTLGASQLVDYFCAMLDAGATDLNVIWRLSGHDAPGSAVAQAIDRLIATRPAMPAAALRTVLRFAAKCLGAGRLRALAEAALANPAVVDVQRIVWNFFRFLLDPVEHGERFVAEFNTSDIAELFDTSLIEDSIEKFYECGGGTSVDRHAMLVRLIGRAVSPAGELPSGAVTREACLSGAVRRSIIRLANHPDRDASIALARLLEHENLAEWHSTLRYYRAQQSRLQRDRNFKHPTPSAIRTAIDCGPPVNAADLRAVVLEELTRLQAELRTNNTTPWKRYWNLDPWGRPTDPRVENACRDHLLERLQDRLKPYRIAAAVPEARRGEETRADMLMLTGTGRDLPLEVKRHFHPEIWTAASTQLQGYAAAEAADGHGIYLVFWFGNEASPTPARLDGNDGPKSARELETMLVNDLGRELRARTEVIVLDVSNPDAPATAPPRRRRGSK